MNPLRFDFQSPWLLLLLVLVPLWWWWRRRKRPDAIVFSRVPVLARGPRAGRGIARALIVLRSLVLILAVVALARPRSSGRSEQSNSEGINIVIAFDISSSMLAEDFQPQNRLEVARERVKQFITQRSSDGSPGRLSGEALTQALTTDIRWLQAAMDTFSRAVEDGTAIERPSRPRRIGCATRPPLAS